MRKLDTTLNVLQWFANGFYVLTPLSLIPPRDQYRSVARPVTFNLPHSRPRLTQGCPIMVPRPMENDHNVNEISDNAYLKKI